MKPAGALPPPAAELRLTPAYVERQYNMRAAVPDHAEWFARWARRSVEARAALPATLDLRYGPGPNETLDLFPAQQPRGLFVFLHGGYWRALDKADHSFLAPALVAQGIGVAVVNYDLCPAVTVGEIGEQCRRALEWLLREGASHGAPAERVVVGGHSAGGHLAAWLFATDWAARGVLPAALIGGVGISGVFDLEPMLDFSYNADLRLSAAQAREWSPSRLTPTLAAPFLICAGQNETTEFARQAALLWERWPACRPAGDEGPMFAADRHHFSVVDDLADPRSALFRRVLGLF